MKITIKRLNVFILSASLLVLWAVGPAVSSAADYPSKPIQIIVPFSPGGGADTSQRTFNKYAEPLVGKTLVIVTKPGAGGTTGWAELVRKKPDGYTMAIVTPPFNVIPPLVRPRQTAADETEVIDAVERLASQLLRHMGESLPNIRRSDRLAWVTTNSLEAPEL